MPQLLVEYLDVSQGDCTLLMFPNGETMLIDCGSISGTAYEDGSDAIKAIKKRIPAGAIDYLVITHGDQDHYNLIGNLVAAGISFRSILYGGVKADYKQGGEATTAALKTLWAIDPPATLTLPVAALQTSFNAGRFMNDRFCDMGDGCMLWFMSANAKGTRFRDKNTGSVTIMLSHNGNKLYFMGDATRATEQWIIANAASMSGSQPLAPVSAGKACVLKAGHHGSETSSCQTWLDAIKPNTVMISSNTRVFSTHGTGMPSESKIDTFKTLTLKQLSATENHDVVLFKKDGEHKGYFDAVPMGVDAICTLLAAGKAELIDTDAMDTADGSEADGLIAFGKPKPKKETRYKTVGVKETIWWIISDAAACVIYWSGLTADGQKYTRSAIIGTGKSDSRAQTLSGADAFSPAGAFPPIVHDASTGAGQ